MILNKYSFTGRYFLNRAPQWGEALATMCYVWIGLLMSAVALRQGRHIKIDMIEKKLSKRANYILDIIIYLCIGFFAYYMVKAGIAVVELTSRNIMPSLHIKTAWLYASFPVAGIFNLLALVANLLEHFFGKETSNSES